MTVKATAVNRKKPLWLYCCICGKLFDPFVRYQYGHQYESFLVNVVDRFSSITCSKECIRLSKIQREREYYYLNHAKLLRDSRQRYRRNSTRIIALKRKRQRTKVGRIKQAEWNRRSNMKRRYAIMKEENTRMISEIARENERAEYWKNIIKEQQELKRPMPGVY